MRTGRKSSAPGGRLPAETLSRLLIMRQVLRIHTSLSRGALKLFTLTSSFCASCHDASTRKCSGMSRWCGRMHSRRAAMRRDSCASTRWSSRVAAKVHGYNLVIRYFSNPSPEASSSSSLVPRHAGCPRNAPSVVRRNSCIRALSASESGSGLPGSAPSPKVAMKALTDLTSSDALGCRIFSKKFWKVRGAVDATNCSLSAMAAVPLTLT
mmetsp:Transcript_2224/g.5247  ORF Transcript_2224/g.5247 Transcript_2224/m.5247 type:complete len:210 (-) Transcript_2224:36-665(-)